MCLMSETSETPTARSSTATAPAPVATEPVSYRAPRVFQLAAWVAIFAGTVFIIAVIFFTGFMLGHSGGHHHHGHHHKHHAMMHHQLGGPGGPGGQGWNGANQPGAPASGAPAPGPGQIPSSVAPSRTP